MPRKCSSSTSGSPKRTNVESPVKYGCNVPKFRTPYFVRYIDPLGHVRLEHFPFARRGRRGRKDAFLAIKRNAIAYAWKNAELIDMNRSQLYVIRRKP